jgi:hypothetical protein
VLPSVAPIIALVWFRLIVMLEAVVEGGGEDVVVEGEGEDVDSDLGNVKL